MTAPFFSSKSYAEQCAELCEGREAAFGFTALEAVFLILSNVTLLPAGGFAIAYREYYTGMWILLSYLASLLYHFCLSGLLCIATLPALHIFDNFFASNMVVVVAVYLAGFGYFSPHMTQRQSALQGAAISFLLVGQFLLLIVVLGWQTSDIATVLFGLLTGLTPLIVRWVWFDGMRGFVRAYRWGCLVAAAVFGAGALVAFYLADKELYGVLHSLWHFFVSIAVFFVIIAKKEHPKID